MRILSSYSFPLGITNAAQAALTVVDANKHLNVFTALHPAEKILTASANAEKREANGGADKLSELDGRLIAIKDNIVTTDLPTSCGSEMLRGSFRLLPSRNQCHPSYGFPRRRS